MQTAKDEIGKNTKTKFSKYFFERDKVVFVKPMHVPKDVTKNAFSDDSRLFYALKYVKRAFGRSAVTLHAILRCLLWLVINI